MFDGNIPANYKFPELGDGTEKFMMLGPKERKTAARIVVPREHIMEAQSGQKRLYFWGWFCYRDIFDERSKHVTKFCVELVNIEGDVTAPGATIRAAFRSHDRHNCADEECER